MQSLRIGLIGCGRLAERGYVPALEQADGVQLAAVADPVPERCENAAPDVPAFDSAAELIAAGAADALVLATPAEAHLVDARQAAAAGLNVLIEKPPAATLTDTLELARLEPAPFFSFNRRFVPRIARMRSALPEQGRVELALQMSTRPGSWRSYVADDDVLLNLGPHLVDLAHWLSGAEAGQVRAVLTSSSAVLDLDLGPRGNARITCREGPYRERIRATPGGSYSAGGPMQALRLLLPGSSVEHPLVPSLVGQLEAFARASRGSPESGLARAHDAVAVMAVLDAAQVSAADGGSWKAVARRG